MLNRINSDPIKIIFYSLSFQISNPRCTSEMFGFPFGSYKPLPAQSGKGFSVDNFADRKGAPCVLRILVIFDFNVWPLFDPSLVVPLA